MAQQLHKRFSTQEVKMLLEKYLNEKVKLVYILEILKIKRSRFFELLRQYREDPDNFSVEYKRKSVTRRISEEVEKNIISELEKEKKLIEDKKSPSLTTITATLGINCVKIIDRKRLFPP
ncbi:MAG: hypothetical protein JSW13_03845 [Candidatus Aerophobus sp.]|nr:MAG: hypothetical protein JSW13_03845 [Candidatus Aerophobus sp.]